MEQLTPLLIHVVNECIHDAVHIEDQNGRVLFANAAATNIFGCDPASVVGLSSHALYQDRGIAPVVETRRKHALETGLPQIIELAIPSEPNMRFYRLRIEPWLDRQGKVLGTINIATDITEEKRCEGLLQDQDTQLEALVESRTAEVRELIGHLQTVREEEKRAIARELHDDLGSSLTALNMHLAMLFQQIPNDINISERTGQIKALMSAVTATTRRLQNGLRPDKLDIFGLKIAITEQAQDFENFSGISCETSLPDEDIAYSTQLEISLFRIVQEALNNIAKHSKATHADIILDDDGDTIYLTIRDNGIGIAQNTPVKKTAHGLLSIRERAAYFGGNAAIDSQPGTGTRIKVTVPKSVKTHVSASEESLKHIA